MTVAVVTLRRVSPTHERRLIWHKERSHIFHCGDMLDNDPESGESLVKEQ
jgi:uncharacterized protein YciI